MLNLRKSQSQLRKYPFLSIILTFYMLIINNTTNSITSIIAILLSLIFVFNPIYILPPLFISSLLGDYFVAFRGIGLSRIMVIIFIVGSSLKFIKDSTKFEYNHIFLILIICGFNIISAITSITGSIIPALTMILNIIMMFFMMYTRIDDFDMFLKTFMYSLIIFSLYIMIIRISGDAVVINDKGIDRLVMNEKLNSNRIGMALAQMTAFIYGGILLTKEKNKKTVYSIVLLINIVNLFFTGSRSAMIAIISSILIIYFINLLKSKKIGKFFFSFLIISILLAGLYFSVINSNSGLISRFNITNILETGGTGRAIIWKTLIKYVIPENLWFGVGLGGENVYNAVSTFVAIPNGTHNFLLTIIAQTGMIGFILYLSFFLKSTKIILKGYLDNDYLVIPLVMVLTSLINGIGEDIFTERFFWFGIGLGFIIIKNNILTLKKGVLTRC